MSLTRRPWQEELAIIDRTMKAISGISDPEELVSIYWEGVGELLPYEDYLALSRRGVEPPYFLVTRSSRFTEQYNPWTQRDRLPRLTGGLLGEIAYANQPVVIEDLPSRLRRDDPGWFYLDGFQSLIALPQYDGGEALNIAVTLLPPGVALDYAVVPMMHWQAGLFGRGTQNLVLRNQLARALGELDRELQVVGNIQRSLLPSAMPSIPGFDIAASYATSARAGGDYYDFFPLSSGTSGGAWGLFIADVSGHGTPAAVLMAITHALAHAQPGTHTPADELLRYLNAHLARSYTRDGTFVTAFYAVLTPSPDKTSGGGTLTYAAAGHNPPRLVRGRQVLSLNETGELPLGIVEDQHYGQAHVTLQRGDLLVLYTDGITEAMAPAKDGRRELFGVERLDRLLLDCGARSARECVMRIETELARFCAGTPRTDDQTVIAIRCA